jgi:glycosyltransferase involved in cell wall biosynthesis
MKVLLIGPYDQGTGYSNAIIEYTMALHEVGVDVVVRPVKMTSTNGEIPPLINDLVNKDLNNIDAVIQYNLPSEFVYKTGVKNIGGFAYETSGFPNTSWQEHISLMDSIMVCSSSQLSSFKHDKKFWIPIPVDSAKFSLQYPRINFNLPKNTTKFYTISEFGRRKNLTALLVAYLSEFTSDDNVVLIIKTHLPGRDSNATLQVVENLVNEIKSGIGKFTLESNRYPSIIIIPEYMSNEQICSLHQSCDVFVSASHGEAFCIPFVEAMGFGNACVAPRHTAFEDFQYIEDRELLVDCFQTPVIGVTNSPSGLYTSDELWFNVDLQNFKSALRNYHNNKKKFKAQTLSRSQVVKVSFSRKRIGNAVKSLLGD